MKSIRRQLHEENGATTAQVVALASAVVVLLFAIVMVFQSGGSERIAADTDSGLINQTELFDGRGHLPPGLNGNAQIGLGDGNGQGGNSSGNPETGSGSTNDGSGSDGSSGGFSQWLSNWKTILGGGSSNPLAAVGDFFVDAGNAIVDGVTSAANGVKNAWDSLPNPIKGAIVGLVVGVAVALTAVAVVATAPVWLVMGIIAAGVVAGGAYGWSVRDSEFSILSAASWAFMASGSVATIGLTSLGASAAFSWEAIRNAVLISNAVQGVFDFGSWAITGQAPYTSPGDALMHYFVATLAAISVSGVFSGLAAKFGFLNKMIVGNMRGYGSHPFYKNIIKPLHNVIIKIPGQKGVSAGTVAKWMAVVFTSLKGPAAGVNEATALGEEYGMSDALGDYVGEGVGDQVGDAATDKTGRKLFGEIVGESANEGTGRFIREITP